MLPGHRPVPMTRKAHVIHGLHFALTSTASALRAQPASTGMFSAALPDAVGTGGLSKSLLPAAPTGVYFAARLGLREGMRLRNLDSAVDISWLLQDRGARANYLKIAANALSREILLLSSAAKCFLKDTIKTTAAWDLLKEKGYLQLQEGLRSGGNVAWLNGLTVLQPTPLPPLPSIPSPPQAVGTTCPSCGGAVTCSSCARGARLRAARGVPPLSALETMRAAPPSGLPALNVLAVTGATGGALLHGGGSGGGSSRDGRIVPATTSAQPNNQPPLVGGGGGVGTVHPATAAVADLSGMRGRRNGAILQQHPRSEAAAPSGGQPHAAAGVQTGVVARAVPALPFRGSQGIVVATAAGPARTGGAAAVAFPPAVSPQAGGIAVGPAEVVPIVRGTARKSSAQYKAASGKRAKNK